MCRDGKIFFCDERERERERGLLHNDGACNHVGVKQWAQGIVHWYSSLKWVNFHWFESNFISFSFS